MIETIDVADFGDDDYNNFVTSSTTEDEFRLRFSSLGLVYADRDEPVFVLALVGANNIDSDDLDADWNVALPTNAIRFVDGVGFTGTSPATAVTDSFGIKEEETSELNIVKSSDSENGRTIEVNDSDTSAQFPMMIFEIEEENDVDVTIDEITMTASTTDTDVTKAIDEVLLVVDGDVIGSDSPNAAGDLRFENLDLDISAKSTMEVAVHVVFNGTERYTEGDVAFVTFNAVTEAEDANGNDEGDIDGAADAADFDSDTFTLRSEGIAIDLDSVTESEDTASFSGDSDNGTYTFVIDVEAFGQNFFIDEETAVVNYTMFVDGVSADAASSTPSITINGADTANGADFRLSRGDDNMSITFTVKTADDVSGSTRVRIDSVDYSAVNDSTMELNVLATPAADWRSGSLILN